MFEEFRPIPDYPGYAISKHGIVRNQKTGHRLTTQPGGSCYIWSNGRHKQVYLAKLVNEIWGIPKEEIVLKEHIPEKRKKNGRVCHDCGEPTTDYRCPSCWQKLRRKLGLAGGA